MAHGAHEGRERPAEGDYEPAESDAGERVGLEDEIRVQRSEEELRTSTRQRPAGAVRVRKSVHTDHEEFRVPRRREEVEIERLPAESMPVESQEALEEVEIGEDEIVMRVYEEEIVVTKRLVPKEEIRLRKAVVQEEEVIEEDLRREEVEIDDQTERGSAGLGSAERGSKTTPGDSPDG